MRFLYVVNQPCDAGKVETVSLQILVQHRKDISSVGSFDWSRTIKSGGSWKSPGFELSTTSAHVVSEVAKSMNSLFRMLDNDDSCNLSDPATVIQAILRNGGTQAVFDPRIEAYVATDRLIPKGNTKYFPIIGGEADREYGVNAGKEELAQKRISLKYMDAIKEDPEIASTFTEWLKEGSPVDKLNAEDVPEAPSAGHYYVGTTEEEAKANLEQEIEARKVVRAAKREENKSKKAAKKSAKKPVRRVKAGE